MIVALAIALLVQNAASPISTVGMTERTGSVQIPDEIAPAVLPYAMCLNDRSNAATRTIMARDGVSGLDGPQVRESNKIAFSDCKAARDTAVIKARKALDSRRIGDAAARSKTIEDTLTGFEASYIAAADKLDEFNKAHRAPGK